MDRAELCGLESEARDLLCGEGGENAVGEPGDVFAEAGGEGGVVAVFPRGFGSFEHFAEEDLAPAGTGFFGHADDLDVAGEADDGLAVGADSALAAEDGNGDVDVARDIEGVGLG